MSEHSTEDVDVPADVNPSTSPTAPAPAPPGDFANDPFFQSPSTWLAIVGGLAPILTVLFKENAPVVIESLAGLGPLIAFVALIWQRNKNHRNVQQLNAQLAVTRMGYNPELAKLPVPAPVKRRRRR